MIAIPKKDQKSKKDHSPQGFSNFGFSSILIGFSMVCVVTFSALALITANSDYNLSKKVYEKTSKYYDTDVEIFNDISDIDLKLSDIYHSSHNSDEYFQKVYDYFSSYEGIDIDKNFNGIHTISFSKVLSQKQSILVKMTINYPKSSKDNFYTITSWKTITDTSVEDDMLNLIGS